LAIQVAIFGTLVLDNFFIRKKNLKHHGMVMSFAFTASTILIFVVILLPFLNQSADIIEDIASVESLLFLSHHVLRLIAELLGGFLVLRWAAKASNASFCKGKTLMRVAIGTWLVSICWVSFSSFGTYLGSLAILEYVRGTQFFIYSR
jgi:uncharacterized membrane protein YozB (DUF420 family)